MEFAIVFMGLALVFSAVMLPVISTMKYNHGFLAGLEARKAALPPSMPALPYECPHLWEPWSKAKWVYEFRSSPFTGWNRKQRRACGQCGEEEERIVQ